MADTPAPYRSFDTRAGAYAVIVEDGRVLLSAWDGPEHPVWTLPGGGIELDESPEEACRREVEEETGHTVELTGLLGVETRTVPAERRLRGEGRPLLMVRVLYTARITGGTLRPETGGSSIDAAWFPVEEVTGERMASNLPGALARAGVEVPAP